MVIGEHGPECEGPDEDGDWQCPVTSRRPDLDTIHHGLYELVGELVGGAGVNDYRLGETMDDPWALQREYAIRQVNMDEVHPE